MNNDKPTIPLQEVNDLRTAFGQLYDEDLKPRKGIVFSEEAKQFDELIKKAGIVEADPRLIERTLERWYEWYSNTTQEPKYEQVDSTVPDSERLKVLEEQADERQRQKSEAKVISDKAVEAFLKRQKEIYEQRLKQQKNVVVIPKEEIQRVTLEKQEKEKLYNLAKAITIDAGTTQIEIERKIQEALNNSSEDIKKNTPPEIITKTAIDLIKKIKPYGTVEKPEDIPDNLPTLNSASPFTATSPFDEYSQTLAIALEAETNLKATLTSSLWGESENITNLLYSPQQITRFEVAEDQERDDGIDLDPKEIYEQSKRIKEIWQKLANKTTTAQEVYTSTSTYITSYTPSITASVANDAKLLALKALPSTAGAIYGFKQGVLLSQWARSGTPLLMNSQVARMLTSGSMELMIASGSVTMSAPTQLVIGKFAVGFSTGVTSSGQQVAIASASFGQKFTGVMGVKGGTTALVETVSSQAGAKLAVGASGLATKVLTFVGGLSSWATFGLSAIGGYLIGKVIEKINWPKVKKWFQENGPVLAGVAGLGALALGGPAVGGIVLLGGLAATGTLGVFAAGAFGVFGFIGRSIGIAIATPVIVTLLIIPPLVAFIMLVINNSAYVVPPSFESGGGGYTPEECLGKAPPKPIASNIKYSSDGKYAYPVAPFEVPGYACYHWDGNKAADIFSPQIKPPMVAYESGTIANVTLNDSLGGKYIILRGASGRHYYYAHLCHVFVGSGESVNVGDVIATMDETGSGRVQHLHYAINKPPLNDIFIGGDGNVCPQEDFEEKFGFGVCNTGNYCVSP